MAKEFKDYDKKFAYLRGQTLEYENKATDFDITKAWAHSQWKWGTHAWGHKEVREAVYFSETSQEWQKFRVSLKGMSTNEKLYRLDYRLQMMNRQHEAGEISALYAVDEQIRIDNYIGALVRGGLLDSDLKVIA